MESTASPAAPCFWSQPLYYPETVSIHALVVSLSPALSVAG